MKRVILTLTTIVSVKPRLLPAITLFAFALATFGCSAKVTTNTNASAPANSNTTATKKAEAPKPKTEIKSEKKPETGTSKTVKKDVPVPANWVYMYDENKGYGFSVPEGSTGDWSNVEGIDVFLAMTPDPNEIGIYILAYKDKTLTKEDLLNDAVKFMEGMGLKVTPGKLHAESDDYALAESSTVSNDGVKAKQKILVGTDVTDNYVMILGTPEDKFAANEKTMDAIWGSFEIWSGGASGGK